MKLIYCMIKILKHKFKIMVGGGAVTEQLAKNMGADAYTENCIEAVEVAKTFIV